MFIDIDFFLLYFARFLASYSDFSFVFTLLEEIPIFVVLLILDIYFGWIITGGLMFISGYFNLFPSKSLILTFTILFDWFCSAYIFFCNIFRSNVSSYSES